ncbi:hypothetical protein LINPERHAP1_LOCUS28851 [Linum perenne]
MGNGSNVYRTERKAKLKGLNLEDLTLGLN